MIFNKNDSLVLLQSENQTLVITFNETKNTRHYTCNASNKFGSAVLTYILTPQICRFNSKTCNNGGKFSRSQKIFVLNVFNRLLWYYKLINRIIDYYDGVKDWEEPQLFVYIFA